MFFLTRLGAEYLHTVESGAAPTMADVQRIMKGTENFTKAPGMILGRITCAALDFPQAVWCEPANPRSLTPIS